MTEKIKSCNTCANATEDFNNEIDNGCYMCSKGIEDNYEPKVERQIKDVIENLTAYVEFDEYNEETIDDNIKLAIRSLKAWSEVLTELEEEKDFWTKQAFKHKDDEFAEGRTFGLSKAIDIINQHLAEIEE